MAGSSRDCPKIFTKIPDSEKERYATIRDLYTKRFGSEPAFFARAPGRVNLIGEHIDYCGYSVLPMAIQQDIVIAAGLNSDQTLNLKNTNPKYKEFTSAIADFKIDQSNPQWHNYLLCGFRGIVEAESISRPSGMNLMVDGNVPPRAGLSSSSALVCCAALVTMYANSLEIPKRKLADICMRCEHYIGTQGGGMDQSICFLAEAGTAKWIQFNPIRATNVSLPQGVTFVISNSCVELQKAATSHFNIRVVECRLGTQILAKSQGLDWRQYRVLAKLQESLGVSLEDMLSLVEKELHPEPYSKQEILAKSQGLDWRQYRVLAKLQESLGVSLEDMLSLVGKKLHPEPYSKQEVCDILGVTEDELNKESLSQNTLEVTSFKLHNRAMHVFGEANRVMKFKQTCDQSGADSASLLGSLMSDSHASCRDLYECSCDQLDRLVELCRASGALGSRLTGAGWGGCTVSIVPTENVDDFKAKVHAGYYANDPKLEGRVQESLFATQPGNGANIFNMDAETSL